MMCAMRWTVWRNPWQPHYLGFFLLMGAMTLNPPPTLGQASYQARFEMERSEYLLGEPIFCDFVIRNTGSQLFGFLYRSPSRVLAQDHEQEPHFLVRNSRGVNLPDSGPQPCGGARGTVVYGSVTLPAGQTHTERWLLNQWARFTSPGRFQVRAERRLTLRALNPQTGEFLEKPAAFALALDELSFEVKSSTAAQIETVFKPYLEKIRNPKDPDPAEAVSVVTTLPKAFFMEQLVAMANTIKPDRWDRRDALNGLARLDTPTAWQAILKTARGAMPTTNSEGKASTEGVDDAVRSYAVLLLAERADSAFLPTLVEMLSRSAEPLRGDILHALGFFHDPRAYRTLFDYLHAAQVTDRMNSILGLKNLGTREVIPPLIAMLNDPEPQVRQVANFALEGLTGHSLALPANPSRLEWERAENNWHAWWREHGGTFVPPRPAACHDW
jgi:hypothetical protein